MFKTTFIRLELYFWMLYGCTGRTTFMIAHRLTTIQNSDRIFVVAAGRIAESGSHDVRFSKHSHALHFQPSTSLEYFYGNVF